MILTTKMKYLVSVILDKDAEAVSRSLLDSGVLHFVNVSTLLGGQLELSGADLSADSFAVQETRKKIEVLLASANTDPQKEAVMDPAAMTAVSWDKIRQEVDRVNESWESLKEKTKNTEQEIRRLEDIRKQLDLFGNLGSAMSHKGRYSFLLIRTGSLASVRAADFQAALGAYPCVVFQAASDKTRSSFVLMNMKKDDASIVKILEEYSWAETEIDFEADKSSADAFEAVNAKIENYRLEYDKAQERVKSLIQENKPQLLGHWANLRMNELFSKMKKTYSHTDRTIVIAGWIPVRHEKQISAAIQKTSNGRCYLHWGEAKEFASDPSVKIPVSLDNPKILSPFQMLVENYGTPEYGTIDPTVFVAVSYVAMFGMMFADLGQGLVILAAAILGLVFGDKSDTGMHKLFQLGVYCGLSAMAFGLAFGSCFGWEIFPAFWFDYHGAAVGHGAGVYRSVSDILVLTIWIGLGIIILGLLLNWITLVRKRRFFKLVFDKTGLVGSAIYGLGFYSLYNYALSSFKSMPVLPVMIILALVVLLAVKPIKETVEHIRHQKARLSVLTVFQVLMEWFVEILEVVTGYLSNTLSFMRVAGLGIAHVFLMVAVFQMADMAKESALGYWVIIVIGNALVIALEGLSAGIQALRLNYYEFFSKYFSGNGLAYSPITVRAKK